MQVVFFFFFFGLIILAFSLSRGVCKWCQGEENRMIFENEMVFGVGGNRFDLFSADDHINSARYAVLLYLPPSMAMTSAAV